MSATFEAEPGRLNGWKEIALHLGKGTRTVQRWEKLYGLPVHRIGREGGEIVFAFRDEIDRWMAPMIRLPAAKKPSWLAPRPTAVPVIEPRPSKLPAAAPVITITGESEPTHEPPPAPPVAPPAPVDAAAPPSPPLSVERAS